MRRQNNLLLGWLLALPLLFLAACALASTPTLAPPTPAAGLSNGQWSGTGKTSDGRQVHLAFEIQGSRLRAITYDFVGQDAVLCTNIAYNGLPEASRASILDGKLAAPLGIDLQLAGSFASANASAGTLQADWQGRRYCALQFNVQWTAIRIHSAALLVNTPRAAVPLCGNGDCAALFLQLLIFGLSNGAVLALNAISVTVVYGAVRTLNLAHGDVFSLTSVLVTSILIGLNVRASWPPALLFAALVLALLAAVGFGMLLNIVLDWLAFRPFRGYSRLAPLIATLGISFILFQAAMFWRTHQGSWIVGEHRSVPGLPEVPTDGIPNLLPSFNLVRALGLSVNVVYGFNDLFILLVALGCALGAYAFLRYTRGGRAIRACMQNPDLAQMNGVNLNATIRMAFAFGGLLAGVAAFIFAVYYGRPFGQNGAQSGLFAFTAAMLGGIGNPFGALASSLLLGISASFSDYFISAEWTPALLLLLLIGLLFLRPSGFFGDDDREDVSTAVLRDSLTSAPAVGRKDQRLGWMLLALALFPIISQVSGLGWQILVRGIGIFMLLALGLNILLGMVGVLDLGYAAAFGIGAYVTAILTNPWGQISALLPKPTDFLLILLVSAVVTGLYGLLKAVLTARLHNETLALATLALGLLMSHLVVNLKQLTGGAAGISALPAPHILGVSFANPTAGYYLVFGLVALAALLSQRLVASRTGRVWLAGSEDETAASVSGVDVARYRMLAMMLGSALAGTAGALYASTFAYVDPDILSFHWTAMLLTMVILGGAGSVPGAMLGVMLIIGYDKLFIPRFPALLALFWPKDFFIGAVPDLRGTSFFNFGIILYLTVLLRARAKRGKWF
jgi:branched-chain amino acid transport system permease protein